VIDWKETKLLAYKLTITCKYKHWNIVIQLQEKEKARKRMNERKFLLPTQLFSMEQ
jgi:hypothetical protein